MGKRAEAPAVAALAHWPTSQWLPDLSHGQPAAREASYFKARRAAPSNLFVFLEEKENLRGDKPGADTCTSCLGLDVGHLGVREEQEAFSLAELSVCCCRCCILLCTALRCTALPTCYVACFLKEKKSSTEDEKMRRH